MEIDKDILLDALGKLKWDLQNDNRNGELLIWKENDKKIKKINEQIKLVESVDNIVFKN
tara:strand:- start:1592 stop:1768 length:177 start_codon:yes stop_codon:yes gene_type:complete